MTRDIPSLGVDGVVSNTVPERTRCPFYFIHIAVEATVAAKTVL